MPHTNHANASTDKLEPASGRTFFTRVLPGVALAYYLGARLGMALAFQPDFISALWPANCVLLAALLLIEPHRWVWLLAATVPAELLADLPAGLSLMDSMHFLAGDWTEALIAAVALRSVLGRPLPLANLRAAGWFVLCAVLLAPALAGLVMAFTAGAEADTVPFLVRWRRWFLGDALAHATITPCLLSLLGVNRPTLAGRSPWRFVEGAALYLVVALMAVVSFRSLGLDLARERAWAYLPLPLLIYAAVRLGFCATCLASSLLAVVGVWVAAHGLLDLTAGTADLFLPDLQLSLLLGVVPALLLAALMEERRAAIQELANDEKRLEGILDSLGVGVLAVDAKGGGILYANPAAVRLTGRPAELLVGLKLMDVMPLQAPDRAPLRPGEQEVVAADGRRVPVIVSQTQTRLRGRTCILTGLTDLTLFKQAEKERARLEEELRQAAKMESIGRLAGGVAHDFNNILQVIGGHLTLVEERTPADSPTRTHLEKIAVAGSHAGQLVRQLLAFSRRHAMRPEALDLNQLLLRITALLRPVLGEAIDLRCEPGAGLPAIQADAHLMEQVVFNLCSNARDALPRGGRLLISTAAIQLSAEDLLGEPDALPGPYVRLLVCDNGVGMDATTRGRIFEPFFTTKEQGVGTGLGLATVYGIVKQHRGVIRVESAPGAGTTFCIYFPVHDRPATVPSLPVHPPVEGGPETILMAEDNEAVRDLETAMLRHAGYRVLAAADGEEAFDLFRRHSREIDLVLLDVVMPRRGGLETAALIRREAPDLPILFMSGYSETLNREDARPGEDFRFLPKPHSRDELLQAVRTALDGVAKPTA